MDKNIVISIKTILTLLLLVLVGYVIYRLGPILAILLIATLIVLALEPLVKKIKSLNIFGNPVSRSAAVIITYAIFVLTLIIVLTTGVPPVVNQAQRLINSLASVLSQIDLELGQDFSITSIIPQLSRLSGGIFGVLSSGFATLTSIFSILMISIYMSLDWENLKRKFIGLFPDKYKVEILRIVEDIELNIGQWVKGQLILMIVIGSLSFLGLLLLRVPYSLALGIIAGILEAVPILGPVIAAVIAAIIAFADTPIKGLAVLALFTVIQQLENNILVPKVMQKVSGFSPLVILIALLIGSNFFGIIGAIVAVPLTMISVMIAKSVLKHIE